MTSLVPLGEPKSKGLRVFGARFMAQSAQENRVPVIAEVRLVRVGQSMDTTGAVYAGERELRNRDVPRQDDTAIAGKSHEAGIKRAIVLRS